MARHIKMKIYLFFHNPTCGCTHNNGNPFVVTQPHLWLFTQQWRPVCSYTAPSVAIHTTIKIHLFWHIPPVAVYTTMNLHLFHKSSIYGCTHNNERSSVETLRQLCALPGPSPCLTVAWCQDSNGLIQPLMEQLSISSSPRWPNGPYSPIVCGTLLSGLSHSLGLFVLLPMWVTFSLQGLFSQCLGPAAVVGDTLREQGRGWGIWAISCKLIWLKR